MSNCILHSFCSFGALNFGAWFVKKTNITKYNDDDDDSVETGDNLFLTRIANIIDREIGFCLIFLAR